MGMFLTNVKLLDMCTLEQYQLGLSWINCTNVIDIKPLWYVRNVGRKNLPLP